MRRLTVVLLGALLAVPVAAPSVSARPERSQSSSYNAFWHIRERVDRDTYLKIVWYAGVYANGDSFWSDLYRSVQRCERQAGRDRCRSGPYMVGVIEDLGDGAFDLDRGLETGYFEATYPMEVYRGREERRAGRINIAVDLAGSGDLRTSTERYTYEDECYRVRYSGSWEYRQAIASGVLTFVRGGDTLDLGDTDDANMGRGRSVSITHETC